MSILKSFCFCFSPKTGSVVLGCMGIVFAVLMIVPPCLILDNHNFYFNEYIRQQKSYAGVDIRDEDIPAIKYFNKVCLASFVAYLVVFTFASILMISGVAARKSYLLVPWLVVAFLTLLFFLIMSISAMFAIASIKALAVLFPAGVPLALGIYFWLAVYSTFALLRSEETAKTVRAAIRPEGVNNEGSRSDRDRDRHVLNSNSTAETEETEVCSTQRPSIPISHSSPTFAQNHVKENNAPRSVSPPPPYETVAVDINKEEEALRSGIERSALALKSRLEPTLTKNDSLDSNGSESTETGSACTTQPLDAIMLAPKTSCNSNNTTTATIESDDRQHLLDSLSFSSSNSTSSKELRTPQRNLDAIVLAASRSSENPDEIVSC